MYLTRIFLTLISTLTVSFFGHFFSFPDSAMRATSCLNVAFFVSLFIFFILIFFVTADNFIQMFVGWASVSLCFYLLINFWFIKIQYNKRAIKAILINHIRDFSLIIGIILIFIYYESFKNHFAINFTDVFFTLSWSSLGLFNKPKNAFTSNIKKKVLGILCNMYAEFVSQMGAVHISYVLMFISYLFNFVLFFEYSIFFKIFMSQIAYFIVCFTLLAPIFLNKNQENEFLNNLPKLLKRYCSDYKYKKFLWGQSLLTENVKKKN